MQRIYANVGKSLRIYSEYLSEVLNDKEGANEIMCRAKDAIDTKQNVSLGASNNIIEDTACIIVSGNLEQLFEMVTFNMSTCKLFGYTKTELSAKKINILFPNVYTKCHNAFTHNCALLNKSQSIDTSVFVLAKHKSGYLLPLSKHVKSFSSVADGLQLMATFKTEKNSNHCQVGYILADEKKNIQAITSSKIKTSETFRLC